MGILTGYFKKIFHDIISIFISDSDQIFSRIPFWKMTRRLLEDDLRGTFRISLHKFFSQKLKLGVSDIVQL